MTMSTIKKIDPKSVAVVENSLGIFDLPVSVVSYNRTFIRELLPLNTLLRDGPFLFRVFSDSNWWDPSRTYIQFTSKIEKKGEGDEWVPLGPNTIEDDKHCSVIQNYALSFIKTLKIQINGVEAYNSGIHYPYINYVKAEFLTPFDAKIGLNSSQLYYSERASDAKGANNLGFKYRHTRFENGRLCTVFAKLYFDLAEQSKLFLPHTDILFSIYPSSDRFLIWAPSYKAAADDQMTANATTYRIKVTDIRLFCTLVDIPQSLQNAVARQLESVPAKYPLRRWEVRTQFLPEGQTSLTFNCFQTILPRRVLVFFVDNSAFEGDPEQSPYNFITAHVESISIESGGIYVPSVPYRLNFTDDSYLRAYYDFHKALGADEEYNIQLITKEYLEGFCGFGFDFRSFNRELDSFELIKNTSTVLKVQLSEAIAQPGAQLVVLGEFDSVLTINNERVISMDGSI
jgi:hypothetical protein